MSQKRHGLSRLTKWFDVRNFVTGVAVAVVAASLVAVIGAIVEPEVRDAFEDFFTAEIWVWVLVLALLVEAGFIGAAFWRLQGRRQPMPTEIREVPYGGVVWPVTQVSVGGTRLDFEVEAPMCPSDKTQLGLLWPGMEHPVPLGGGEWKSLGKREYESLELVCLKCHTPYDFTHATYSLGDMAEVVRQLALGQSRQG